jgi:hypothetical protein
MSSSSIKEDLIQFLWKARVIPPMGLFSTTGQAIEILNYGNLNEQEGPDFQSAKIKIGKTIWAGHVEMHVRSSDWFLHNHSDDPAYKNVILHVVFEEDSVSPEVENVHLPCLEISKLITPSMLSRYHALKNLANWVPCEPFLPELQEMSKISWLERLAVERLHSKSSRLDQLHNKYKGHWDKTLFTSISRSFGTSTNAEAFENWAETIPFKVLPKYQDKSLMIEALFLGQAGFLDKISEPDDYSLALIKEYEFLKNKHSLKRNHSLSWKFMRVRPPNHPTSRIIQLASIYQNKVHLFREIIESNDHNSIIDLLSIKPGNYWRNHNKPGASSKSGIGGLSKGFIELLLINTVAPMIFYYGLSRGNPSASSLAYALLENCKAEQNTITKRWKTLNMPLQNAADSQALIQLRKEYCNNYRCMECRFGSEIILSKKGSND